MTTGKLIIEKENKSINAKIRVIQINDKYKVLIYCNNLLFMSVEENNFRKAMDIVSKKLAIIKNNLKNKGIEKYDN